MDYEFLRFIWWLLIGVLLIGFAVTDGFDMGVGALLKIVGKTDNERRVMINAVAPHWDGNQVWLITAGGALFAAWPPVYATSFSGFYLAMILTLVALYMRPIGFDYRSKLDSPRWRSNWDWALTFGSSVPPIIFGVAFGNLLIGVPFHFDELLRIIYTGSFFALLNPFCVVGWRIKSSDVRQPRCRVLTDENRRRCAKTQSNSWFNLWSWCSLVICPRRRLAHCRYQWLCFDKRY